ncbi:unnamed protein product [Miscanthus lutarioriparius]|uniref:Glutathione peroxidase n=1 Tax=Miscanthus lutarioriparius TaxID=422564 RepID=A0A811QCX6_9POAL|nr:unnamed protein product [Miscanthus lutarioriparius]
MIEATRGLRGSRLLSVAVLVLAIALVFRSLTPAVPQMADDLPTSIYDITIKISDTLFSCEIEFSIETCTDVGCKWDEDIRGDDIKLSEYAGEVLLIVNVASKCGLTSSNYKELNVLYEKYREKGLEILALPCNQFAGQEPGSNEDIQETIDVNGKDAAPLYKYLKSQKGGFLGDGIKWNFTKFLVDKDGKVVERYAPTTSPSKIENDIQKFHGTAS